MFSSSEIFKNSDSSLTILILGSKKSAKFVERKKSGFLLENGDVEKTIFSER